MASSGPRRARRLSSAHVVAFLALFVALGSGAYAVTEAPPDSVTSASVKDDTLQSEDIKQETLTAFDIKPDSLGGGRILESSLKGVNAATLGGQPPTAFASATAFRRTAISLGDSTTGDGPKTVDLVPGGIRVIASCENTGNGALTGKIIIKGTANGWTLDTLGGTIVLNDKTNLPANSEQVPATFGPTTNRHIATVMYSTGVSAVHIDGIASVEVHPNGAANICNFSSGAFVTAPS